MKICKYCKWFQEEVCVNGDSDKCADFVIDCDTCDKYEEACDEPEDKS